MTNDEKDEEDDARNVEEIEVNEETGTEAIDYDFQLEPGKKKIVKYLISLETSGSAIVTDDDGRVQRVDGRIQK